MNKRAFLDAAEIFDTWRVIPRVLLFAYAVWVVALISKILNWYFALPSAERTLETSGVVSVIITAVTGFSPWIFKIYSDNGRDWSAEVSTSTKTSVVSNVQTVTPAGATS